MLDSRAARARILALPLIPGVGDMEQPVPCACSTHSPLSVWACGEPLGPAPQSQGRLGVAFPISPSLAKGVPVQHR